MTTFIRETEAAELLDIPITSLRNWRKAGYLRNHRIAPAQGKPVLVDVEEIKRFCEEEQIYYRRGA